MLCLVCQEEDTHQRLWQVCASMCGCVQEPLKPHGQENAKGREVAQVVERSRVLGGVDPGERLAMVEEWSQKGKLRKGKLSIEGGEKGGCFPPHPKASDELEP